MDSVFMHLSNFNEVLALWWHSSEAPKPTWEKCWVCMRARGVSLCLPPGLARLGVNHSVKPMLEVALFLSLKK